MEVSMDQLLLTIGRQTVELDLLRNQNVILSAQLAQGSSTNGKPEEEAPVEIGKKK